MVHGGGHFGGHHHGGLGGFSFGGHHHQGHHNSFVGDPHHGRGRSRARNHNGGGGIQWDPVSIYYVGKILSGISDWFTDSSHPRRQDESQQRTATVQKTSTPTSPQTTRDENIDDHQYYDIHNSRAPNLAGGNRFPLVAAVFFSLALLAVLVSRSTEYTTVLQDGQTYHLPHKDKNPFVQNAWNLKIEPYGSVETPWNLYMYSLDECPGWSEEALTSDRAQSQDISLGTWEYEYDYFLLYPGSTMDITLTVATGSVEFSVWKVSEAEFQEYLKEDATDGVSSLWLDDVDDMSHETLIETDIYEGNAYSYQTTIVSSESDEESVNWYYLLLYLGNGNDESQVTVDLEVTQTLFDLSQVQPTLTMMTTFRGSQSQVLSADTAPCSIVQVAQTNANGYGNDDANQGYNSYSDYVLLHASCPRRWLWILSLSALPLLFWWYQNYRDLTKNTFIPKDWDDSDNPTGNNESLGDKISSNNTASIVPPPVLPPASAVYQPPPVPSAPPDYKDDMMYASSTTATATPTAPIMPHENEIQVVPMTVAVLADPSPVVAMDVPQNLLRDIPVVQGTELS